MGTFCIFFSKGHSEVSGDTGNRIDLVRKRIAVRMPACVDQNKKNTGVKPDCSSLYLLYPVYAGHLPDVCRLLRRSGNPRADGN